MSLIWGHNHVLAQITIVNYRVLEYPIVTGRITIPSSHWQQVRGANITPSTQPQNVVIALKNGRVDLSAFTYRAETFLNQSNYENPTFIRENVRMLRESQNIQELCESLPVNEKEICLEDLDASARRLEVEWLEQQNQRILYPAGYSHIGNLPKEDVEYVERLLNEENCQSLCENETLVNMLLFGTEGQFQQIANHLQHQGEPSCLKSERFQLNLRYVLENNNIPTICQGSQDHNVCQSIHRDTQQIKRRMQHLSHLLYPAHQAQPIEACQDHNHSSLSSSISDFLENLEQHLSCNTYQSGEERVKNIDDSISYTTHGYRIKKEADGSYTATLAVKFQPSEDYTHTENLPSSKVNAHYRQVLQGCLDEASPKMLGPNGERLNVIIADAESVPPCTPKTTIRVGPHGPITSTKSVYYPSNIDQGYCPILVHEGLHNLGLNDSYISTTKNQENSITDQGARLSINETNCSHAKFQVNSIMSDPYQRFYNVFEAKKDESLLDPAHFNQIIYAGCHLPEHPHSTHLFRACSEFEDSMNCSRQRNMCEGQNSLGRNNKES